MEDFALWLFDIIIWSCMWYAVIKVVEVIFMARSVYAKAGEVEAELDQQRRGELQNFINEAQGTIQQRAGEMNKQVIADIRTQSEKVAKAKEAAAARDLRRLKAARDQLCHQPVGVAVGGDDHAELRGHGGRGFVRHGWPPAPAARRGAPRR